jgi:hypothetical protein
MRKVRPKVEGITRRRAPHEAPTLRALLDEGPPHEAPRSRALLEEGALHEAGAKHGPVSGNALDQRATLNMGDACLRLHFRGQISGMLYQNIIKRYS